MIASWNFGKKTYGQTCNFMEVTESLKIKQDHCSFFLKVYQHKPPAITRAMITYFFDVQKIYSRFALKLYWMLTA